MLKLCCHCQKEFRALNARRKTCGTPECLRKNKNKPRNKRRYLSKRDIHTDWQSYLDTRETRKFITGLEASDRQFKKAIGDGTF